MKRAFAVVVFAVVVVSGLACKAEPPAQEASTSTSSAPPALAATKAIYEGYAKAPSSFDRLPHLSRFYIDDNQKKDAACASGDGGPACRGDRFVCLDRAPTKPGTVVEARVDGEQPGVSASVKLKLAFGEQSAAFDVDVVYEGGTWKVDQVRCP